MTQSENQVLACSFCGKNQHEVFKLIKGPGVNACDECIQLMSEIVAEDRFRRTDRTSHPEIEAEVLAGMKLRRPDLTSCVSAIERVHDALVNMYDLGGKLLLCGNGGSNADSMHIAGELCKSFERKRTLPKSFVEVLKPLPCGEDLANHLEAGLAAIALGFNGSLKTAVENDIKLRDMAFAQEAAALAKPGDVIIGISTSGNATNCLMAMSVVKAIGGTVVSLTGPNGGKMAAFADIAIKAPGDSVKVIQEAHLVIYHTICAMIEAHYFPEPR